MQINHSNQELNGFKLGEFDFPSHLIIPDRLYGREQLLEQLQSSFTNSVKIESKSKHVQTAHSRGFKPFLFTVTGSAGLGSIN